MGGAAGGTVMAAAGHNVRNMAGDLDVIVGELAELAVVEAKILVVDADTQAEAGDQVHQEEDEAGQGEGPGETGDGASQLVAELDVVVLDPTAGNRAFAGVGAIEGSNVGAGRC